MEVTVITIILPIALVIMLAAWGIVLFSLVAAARGGKAALRLLRRQVQNRKSAGKDDPSLSAADQWLDLSQ